VPASTLTENKQLASDVHKLNMHITAAKPKYHKVSDVPTEMIEHEKDIILKQMDDAMKGKPAQVLEKIVAGKLNKFYQEVVLEEQAHMLSEESNMTIKKELDRLGVDITDYIQWQVGEEQEVQEEQ
jgi:elongation factor Ts